MARPFIAFLGGGNMGRSLVGGLIARGHPADRIAIGEPDAAARAKLAHDFGITTGDDNASLAARADVIVLAVKPQVMATVCAALRPVVADRAPLVVSIAAGVRIAQFERWLGTHLPIVRAMPNTPALIGAGITGLCANARCDAAARDQAQAILSACGATTWIADEALMDAVTAVSGSGPAYFFLLIEALEAAAIAQGLPAETARALVVQTALGAARMASEGGEAPATLRERVTSPGGTTQAALQRFEAGGLRALVADAVAAATARGRELSAALDEGTR